MINNKYWVFGVEFSSDFNENPHMFCVDLLDLGDIVDLSLNVDVDQLKTNWEEYLKNYIELMDLRFGDQWRSNLIHKYPKIYYSVKNLECAPEMYCVIQPDSGETSLFHSFTDMLNTICPQKKHEG